MKNISNGHLYNIRDSWWNPRFLDSNIEKEFRLQVDSESLSTFRVGLGIIIFFWFGFLFFDQFLSPSTKLSVLKFRFLFAIPVFLTIGGISFTKIATRFYQLLIIITEALVFIGIICVNFLYDDLGFLVQQFGLHLFMPSHDAKFIFVSIWLMILFIGSLSFRIRTSAALLLSAVLLINMIIAVYVFKPSGVLIALAGPFILACIPLVITSSLMRQKLALSNHRVTKLLENTLDVVKSMFGRYISTEVMNSLIENPAALELGGEKRRVTIMMTDLRGFAALSERLEPEQVVQMLNAYFEIMVEVVLKYKGTIDSIIADALLVIFGAPQDMPDRAEQAIACAIEMQNAMAKVNEQNRARGLPQLEMGIGLNETEVIVGNIGSSKRSKYTVVGSGVNMASRIESYSVGGQVLISESLRQQVGHLLRIDSEQEIFPKGAETPIKIYEIGGIAGQYNLSLEEKVLPLVDLVLPISLVYKLLEGKSVHQRGHEGSMLRLSKKCAEIILNEPVEMLTNLKMNLRGVDENLAMKNFYGKVIECPLKDEKVSKVRFTSVPPEVDAYFQSHRLHSESLQTR